MQHAWHGMAWHGMACMAWYGMAWHGHDLDHDHDHEDHDDHDDVRYWIPIDRGPV